MKLNGNNILAFMKGKSFEHRGEYNSNTIYKHTGAVIDCFYYAGNAYYTKKTAPAGTLPIDTAYFGVMASGSTPAELSGFAESERQKSKNLFNMSSAQLSGTATISINGNTLTVSNNGDYGYVGFTVNVKPNTTYTLSRLLNIVTSGNENTGDIGIYLSNEVVGFKADSSENYITFTTGDETEITMYFYVIPWGYTGTGAVEFSNIQLEEGSVVTDYQPYNGAIVHEKDIADVEHVETIYDVKDTQKQIIDSVAYTDGLPNGTYTQDLTKYKALHVYCTTEGRVDSGSQGAFYLRVDLKTTIGENNEYIGVATANSVYGIINNPAQTELRSMVITINTSKTNITVLTANTFVNNTSESLNIYKITKIEGVY